MGEVSEMMLTGILCGGCGEALDCGECAKMGIPMYCSERCAQDASGPMECVHSDEHDTGYDEEEE